MDYEHEDDKNLNSEEEWEYLGELVSMITS
jgi:hypothetical protein